MQVSVTLVGGGTANDVVTEVEPTTSVAEFAHALGLHPGDVFAGPPTTELADTGVRQAGVIPRHPAPEPPPGTARLEVVGGPFAGEVIPLPLRTTVSVGSGPRMLVGMADPAVAEHHVDVEVLDQVDDPAGSVPPGPGTVDAADSTGRSRPGPRAVGPGPSEPGPSEPGPTGPGPWLRVTPVAGRTVVVNGVNVTDETLISAGELIQVGSSVLRLGVVPAPNADTAPEGLAHVGFNRGARIRPAAPTPVVQVPGERPKDAQRRALPWLSALLPVVMGVAMATFMHSPRFLMFAVMSPVMVLGNHLMGKRTAKRAGVESVEAWREQVVEARAEIATLQRVQRQRAWRLFPDPVTLTDTATVPLARLWERRLDDPDAALVRVGLGDVDLDVQLEGRKVRAEGIPVTVGVSPAPIAVDLAAGVVGVAGPRPMTAALGRAMLCGLAVGRSPRDLKIVVLCEDGGQADWAWVRWLPHVAGEGMCTIGNTDDTRRDRIGELTAVIEARRRTSGGSRVPAGDVESHYVVLVDQSRALRTVPGMLTVLEDGPQVGVFVIALDEDRARLPQESATEVLVDGASLTMARVASREVAHEPVLLDGMAPWQAERIARALAPIVHVTGAGDRALLPRAVRFVDLVGLTLDDPGAVLRSWATAPRSTRAVVGAGLHGPFALDLAADGPHALVAGTTGAGKSEFLQTFVVSLALANRPDALNFVLVDYKGGAAFADCERLPHTVGMVTNLDGRGTERALESLDAELKRREKVLREMGAKDADTAWDKDPATASARAMARLVLVIDEFAELKSEHPTFIDGLIRIARVGRSLGVHLVLATQRPAGAITPEMQSNTNLRVALRVTDKADSTDVLGSPEAATIGQSTPGRGYARQGVGVAPVQFQTARVAGRRPGAVHQHRAAPRVAARDWWHVGLPVEFPARPATDGPVDHDDTDLRAIVDLIRDAAARAGMRPNPSPWLEPLPALLSIDQIGAATTDGVAGGARPGGAVVLGLEDVPGDQTQAPLTWHPVTGSHLAFVGGARSGRTSALRTIAAQLALAYEPEDLHLYAIDYGGGGLAPLAGLPHTGAVIGPTETGRADRLWDRLFDEVARRRELMARHGVGSLQELLDRAHDAEKLAVSVLLIDGWDGLLADAVDFATYRKMVSRFLREAPAAGFRAVVTGDKGLGADSIIGYIPERLVLPLTDRADYYNLAGVSVHSLPDRIPPGRVLLGKPTREIQLALLPGDPSGAGQHEKLTSVVETVRRRRTEPRSGSAPLRVDPLPLSISVEEANRLPVIAGCPHDGAVVAVGGDELSRYTLTLDAGQHLLVAGEPRSGRSSTLAALLAQTSAHPAAFVIAPRSSPLREQASMMGRDVLGEDALSMTPTQFVDLAMAMRETADSAGQDKILVFCDDTELVHGSPLETCLLENADAISIFAATSSQASVTRGLDGEARKGRLGIVLAPRQAMEGTMSLGLTIPSTLLGVRRIGSGVLLRDGIYTAIQVPSVW